MRAAPARRRRAARPGPSASGAPRGGRCSRVGGVVVALAGVYSLAAPWLAQRTLATATTAADFQRAHSYDPLSTEALTDWAAFEDGAGNVRRAQQLYVQAVDLEPHASDTWYALGAFYADHGAWLDAYTRAEQRLHVRPLRARGHAVRPARRGAPEGVRLLAA